MTPLHTPREFGLCWVWGRWRVQLLSLGFQVRAQWILLWVKKQNFSVIMETQEQIKVTFLRCLTLGLDFLHSHASTNSEILFMCFKPMVSCCLLKLILIFVSHKNLQPLNAVNQHKFHRSLFLLLKQKLCCHKTFPNMS